MSVASAGWYIDPQNPSQQRYWDGASWSDHFAPVSPRPVQAEPPPAPPGGDTVPRSAQPLNSADAAARGLGKSKGLFAGKRGLEEENSELRAALTSLGVAERQSLHLEIEALQRQRSGEEAAMAEARRQRAAESDQLRRQADEQRRAIQADLDNWRSQVVATSDEAILQEVGIYNYRHPLDSAVAYKAALDRVQAQLKSMAKTDRAVVNPSSTQWQVQGSATQGRAMIRDISKLMLRAYNNEADDLVRTMKPYKLDAAKARLDKAAATISRLAKVLGIAIDTEYHRLRWVELDLTADFLAKKAEEKEREREEKMRLREEEKARREFEAEKLRLAKEAAHYAAALAVVQANGDAQKAQEIETKLAEIQAAISGVDARAANIRAGYVYVISNIGAFGNHMVKVGMTRRLDPMDRVRELGDASVPFRYDVHALIFSDDAVGLETQLHRALAAKRVNLVNMRREFFYATVGEVRDLLVGTVGNALLEFDEHPTSEEFRVSDNLRRTASSS